MEGLSKRLSRSLVELGVTAEDDEEVVAYGLFCMMSGFTQVAILLVLSLTFHTLTLTCAFVLFFALIKRTAGGWHAKTHLGCLSGFTAMTISASFMAEVVPVFLLRPLTAVLVTAELLIIWLRGPVAHPNSPKSPAKLKQFHSIIKGVSLVQTICISVALLLGEADIQRHAFCAALGGTMAAVTLLIPIKIEGGESNED